MAQIPTTFLILSDTHGESMSGLASLPPVDVAIHCGDLTEESKLEEFDSALHLLPSIKAGLKLVIAGNHDLSMDVPRYEEKIRDALASTGTTRIKVEKDEYDNLDGINPATAPSTNISLTEIHQTFGYPDLVPQIFDSLRNEGIILLLGEGIYDFCLANGAWLRVFASSFTPSCAPASFQAAFQYSTGEGHTFGMSRKDDIDVVTTHGPPHGILDRTVTACGHAGDTGDKLRAGCPELFAAVEAARPRLHCFGHVHEGWGAKVVTWRDRDPDLSENQKHEELETETETETKTQREREREKASHFTVIDNDHSYLVESLATLKPGRWDSQEVVEEKRERLEGYKRMGYCGGDFSVSPSRSSSMLMAGNFSPISDASGYNVFEMDGYGHGYGGGEVDGYLNLLDAAMDADGMDIDHDYSHTIVNGQTQMKTEQMDGDEYGDVSNGEANALDGGLEKGKQTLFVNAAIQALDEEDGQQLPWIVTIDLPEAPPSFDDDY